MARTVKNILVNTGPSTSATRYNGLGGLLGSWSVFEFSVEGIISCAGIISNLVLSTTAAPGVGTSWTITLRVNNIDTSVVIVLSDLATVAISTGSATVAPGDIVTLRSVPSGTPTSMGAHAITWEFVATASDESVYLGSKEAIDDVNVLYNGLWTSSSGLGAWVSDPTIMLDVSPLAGIITRSDYDLTGSPGAGKNYTFAIFKNGIKQDGTGGTPDTRVVIADTAESGSATFSLSVAPGDTFYVQCIPTGTPTLRSVAFSHRLKSTVAGQTVFGGHDHDGPSNSATWYAPVTQPRNWGSGSGLNIGSHLAGVTKIIISGLRIVSKAAPGTGKTRTISLEQNGAPAGPTVTISGTETTGVDSTHSSTLVSGDQIGMKSVPTGTPASTHLAWAFILVEPPTIVVVPPPVAPRAPCQPQNTVTNGGKGNAGCTPGGIGRISSYTGPYGSVPNHPDPVNGETLTDKERDGLEIWAELIHTPYPVVGSPNDQVTYRRAMVELADDPSYEGGRKIEGLLTVGDIENALGHEQGGPEANTVELEFSDTIDRTFRVLLDTQDLEGDEVRVKAASDAGRALAIAPRILSRAIVQHPRLRSRLRASLSAVDQLFSDFGPFGPNRTFPFWTFGDLGSSMGGAPSDTKATVIPSLYGEKSDEGAVDPITGASASKGLIPGIYCGMFTGVTEQTSHQVIVWANPLPLDTTIAPVTTAGANNRLGGTLEGDISVLILAVKNGKVSTISNPAGNSYSPGGRAVSIFWNSNGATAADSYLIFIYTGSWGVFDPFATPATGSNVSVRFKTHDNTTIDGFWTGGQQLADFRIDFDSLTDGTDALGFTTVTDPDEWGFLAFGLGPWFRYLNVYGSNLGGTDSAAMHDRVRLDVAARNDILVPGINYLPRTIRFTSDEGQDFDLTGIWVKGGLLEDHLNGVVNITANAIGRTEDGTGDGLPIIDAFDVLQFWLENDVINKWTSGPVVSAGDFPRWEDGTAKVRTSSFRTRQTFTKDQFGGRGLTVGWYMDRPKSVTDLIGDWMRQTDCRIGSNGHGQIIVWGLDETDDHSSWRRIDDAADLFGPITRVSGEDRANVVSGSWDWDPDSDRFRGGPAIYSSDVGIAKYKDRRKLGNPIDFTILIDEQQARWVLQRTLARLQLGTTLVEVSGSAGFMDQDVGDGIRLTTEEGTGADGYVDRPFYILRRRFNVGTRLTTYTLWDVQDVLLATKFPNGLQRLFYWTDNAAIAPKATDDTTLAPIAF